MTRPTYDDIYMRTALAMAERATCPRASVGAVIVNEANRVIAAGYNGSPQGQPHCTDTPHGCMIRGNHCVRTIHAEANALINAVASPKGATLYVTHFPCVRCANLVVQAGVRRVVYAQAYGPKEDQIGIFARGGCSIEHLPESILRSTKKGEAERDKFERAKRQMFSTHGAAFRALAAEEEE